MCVCVCIEYVCVYSYIGMYVGVLLWVYTCMYMHVCWVHVWECYVFVLIPLPLCVFGSVLQWFRLVRATQTWYREIQVCVRYGPDTLAIWRSTHGMARWSVLVHAVETRRRFNSEIALFHVSVCLCLISLFTVVNRYLYFSLIISCDYLMCFSSMFTRITSWDIIDYSPYLFCWTEYLLASFHV